MVLQTDEPLWDKRAAHWRQTDGQRESKTINLHVYLL